LALQWQQDQSVTLHYTERINETMLEKSEPDKKHKTVTK